MGDPGPWAGIARFGLVPDEMIGLQAELDGQRSDIATIRVGPGMEQYGIVLRMP